MNIMLINHYAGSTDMGMEFRPYYMAREWIKQGHNVWIVAGDYSHLRKQNPCVNKDLEIQVIDKVHYCWFKTGKYSGNGIKRAITMFRFCVKLLRYKNKLLKTINPDVVISSSTYPIDTFPAQIIAKRSKARLIHEVHDVWPATLTEIGGMSKHNPFVILMQLGENSAYRNSDYVVSILPLAEKHMMKHGLTAGKFVAIENGIIEEDWRESEDIPEQHKKLFDALKDDFIVGYFGGHALSNALDDYLNVAKMCTNPQIKFVLVGDGVEKERLRNRIKHENISNVYFLPSVSKKSIPTLLQHFQCMLMPGIRSPLYRFGIGANKIIDALMAGVPNVCMIDVPASPVSQSKCGVMIRSGDLTGALDAIYKYFEMDQEEFGKIRKNGHEYAVQNYRYPYLAQKFSDLFN